MSYINLEDRIKERSYSTGTGDFSLDGAMQGFSAFSSVYSSGDSLFYAISDGTNYEIGSGVYVHDSLNDYLKRFVFRSTNSDNLVNFNAGIKEVYVTYPGRYSVFTASGLSDFEKPQASGLAFWESSQILNYDSNIIWDATNNRLGINTASPEYSIQVGGTVSDSSCAASGFIVGDSGIMFSGIDPSYSGGRQREPFFRNELDNVTGTDGVFELSGIVDQKLLFKKQAPATVFAGPSGECGCTEDYPTFRALRMDDIPELSGWVLGKDAEISGWNQNYTYNVSGWNQNYTYNVSGWASQYVQDQLAGGLGFTYWEIEDGAGRSGIINHSNTVYISGISGIRTYFDDSTSNLIIDPSPLSGYLSDYISGVSGYLETSPLTSASTLTVDHIVFGPTDREISIGLSTNESTSESGIFIGHQASYQNKVSDYSIGIGYQALAVSSGHPYAIAIGYRAGLQSSGIQSLTPESRSILIGYAAGYFSTGKENTFIGNEAGYQASGGNTNIAIGNLAGKQLDTANKIISIGDEASIRAVNSQNCISIGENSFADSEDSSYLVSIGYQASQTNIFSQKSVAIGYRANSPASGISDCVSIGSNAGFSLTNSNDAISIGQNANRSSLFLTNTISIGENAGYKSSGCLNSLFIGENAGYHASGNNYSVYIGKDAGKLRDLNSTNSLVIKTNDGAVDYSNADATNRASDSIISINDVITGRMYDGVNNTNLRIGASGSLSEYTDFTLSIKPNVSSNTALHLEKLTGQSSPLLTSRTSNSTPNTIVDKNGYLKVPNYSSFAAATGEIGVASSSNIGVLFIATDNNRLWISNGTNWVGFNADNTV